MRGAFSARFSSVDGRGISAATAGMASNPSRFAPGKFTGSKNADGVYHKIINRIPPCGTFIELFAGTAAIARRLRPAAETLLVDVVDRPELRHLARAMPGARFIHGDGIAFANHYKFRGGEFIYADPPYLGAARAQRGRNYYGPGEMLSEAEHARLLRTLKAINCNVLLSGYRSPLYDRELCDWHRLEFSVMTLGGTKATEVLWANYPPPVELHDYRYVGETWRERQDLRRMIAKAVARVAGMDPLKRNAFLDALREFMADRGASKGALRGFIPSARGAADSPRQGSEGPAAAPGGNAAAARSFVPAASGETAAVDRRGDNAAPRSR